MSIRESDLPEFSMDDERARDITVRQLLSHTAGIRKVSQRTLPRTSRRSSGRLHR